MWLHHDGLAAGKEAQGLHSRCFDLVEDIPIIDQINGTDVRYYGFVS